MTVASIPSLAGPLPLPDLDIETPCFVILESAVEHNFHATACLAGGVDRLVPHVKTHRAPWLTRFLIDRGVRAFKTATPRELEMVLEAGASEVIWAYPTTNVAAITRVIAAADAHPHARITGLVDNHRSLDGWSAALGDAPHANVSLRVDLDPGMGRTGVAVGDAALDLAREVAALGRFGGWHIYDGHLQDRDLGERERRFLANQHLFAPFFNRAEQLGLDTDIVAGGSYTYPLWARHTQARVSPGSWVYSSSQHQAELADHQWKVAAYVVSTVLSERDDTLTLDAGSKAVSPDMPMERRFAGVDRICGMKEEHTIVSAHGIQPGDRIAVVPRHACTTAYLYRRALVLTKKGTWEYRDQLGCER